MYNVYTLWYYKANKLIPLLAEQSLVHGNWKNSQVGNFTDGTVAIS